MIDQTSLTTASSRTNHDVIILRGCDIAWTCRECSSYSPKERGAQSGRKRQVHRILVRRGGSECISLSIGIYEFRELLAGGVELHR